MTARWCFALILVAAIALRLALALALPFDAAPDERWRYDVTRQIYRTGRAPRWGYDTPHHFVVKPILGYRLNAWLAHAAPGALPLFRKLRLGSALVTVLTIVLAYWASRNLWPSHPWWATATAAMLAFHPKFIVTGAYLNADAYTVFAVALVFFLLTLVHRRQEPGGAIAVAFGLALGLVFLGRENGYAAFILAAGYAGYLLWQNWRPNGRMLVVSFAVWLIFPTVFYLHQYFTYGMAFIPGLVGSGVSWVPPGFTVTEAYASFPSAGFDFPLFHLDWWQPWHWFVYLPRLFTTSLQPISFLSVDFPGIVYAGYFLFGLFGLVGLGRSARWTARGGEEATRSRRWLLMSAFVAGVLLFGIVVRHSFVVLYQPDGRHLLPLLVPALLLAFHGWRTAAKNSDIGEAVTVMGVGFFIWSGISAMWLLVPLYV